VTRTLGVMERDPYLRLRGFVTPTEDLCDCAEPAVLQLMYALTSNPICCLYCNREVPPERIDLSVELVDQVASWNSLYGAFYTLWLDSGEWEAFAVCQLQDPQGRLVQAGLDIVHELSKVRPAYLAWHSDEAKKHEGCPRCDGELDDVDTRIGTRHRCESCRIVLFA
jgi:predicted  nucleic acid-binding Zn ribbon protein